MCGCHLVVDSGRIDLAAGIRNDLPILEVCDQRRVIGVNQPRAADEGEGQNVFVVGPACAPLAEIVRTRIEIFVRHHSRPANAGRSTKPSDKPVVTAQLPPKVAVNDQPPPWTRKPIEEVPACRRAAVSEYFVGHVGIDDPAHQRPTERRASSMKNCP